MFQDKKINTSSAYKEWCCFQSSIETHALGPIQPNKRSASEPDYSYRLPNKWNNGQNTLSNNFKAMFNTINTEI